MLVNRANYWTHNAFELQRIINRDKAAWDEYFVLVGGSATAVESITSSKEASKILSKKTGKRIGFSNLGASYGSLSDCVKIISALKEADVTIILGIEPISFNRDQKAELEFYNENTERYERKYYYLPVPKEVSTILKEEGVSIPLSQYIISLNCWPTVGEWLKKSLIRKIEGKKLTTAYNPHDRRNVPVTPERMEVFRKRFIRNKNFAEQSKRPFLMMDAIVQIIKDSNLQLILFELPKPDLLLDSYKIMAPDYPKAISKIVDDNNFPYLDFQNSGPWKREYYRDAHHMTKAGRQKLTDLITTKLAEIILGKNKT